MLCDWSIVSHYRNIDYHQAQASHVVRYYLISASTSSLPVVDAKKIESQPPSQPRRRYPSDLVNFSRSLLGKTRHNLPDGTTSALAGEIHLS